MTQRPNDTTTQSKIIQPVIGSFKQVHYTSDNSHLTFDIEDH